MVTVVTDYHGDRSHLYPIIADDRLFCRTNTNSGRFHKYMEDPLTLL